MIRNARWFLVLAAVAASVNVLVVVDQGSHSVSDTVSGSALYLAVIWLVAGVALVILSRRQT